MHDDVGGQEPLNLDSPAGRQGDLGPVDVGLKDHAVVIDLPQMGQRKDLVSSAVGKDGAVPGHEPMEASQSSDHLCPRPQHQVVGIGQHDLHADGV